MPGVTGADRVGTVEPGKWADLVIWKPAFFGVKPALILKGGFRDGLAAEAELYEQREHNH